MGFELVSGAPGRGQGATRQDTGQEGTERQREAGPAELAEVERLVADARLRLGALADRLADLRRRLDQAGQTGTGGASST